MTGARRDLSIHAFCGVSLLILSACMPSFADDSRSVYKLGERFFNDSLYSLALEQYQKFLNLKREDPELDATVHFRVAVCHYRMENYRKAAEALERYVKLFPSEDDVMEAIYLAGASRKQLGDFREASDWFYSIWSRFVGSSRARLALFEAAWCAEMGKNPERAIELYETFFSKFPGHAKSREASPALVKLYLAQQDYPQAEQVLGKIRKLWRDDDVFAVRVLYYSALLDQMMQRDESAAKSYRAMKERDEKGFPERRQAYDDYIEFLTSRGKYDESLDLYRRLADIHRGEGKGEPAAFLWDWAESARKARSYDAAAGLYQRLLDKKTDSVDVLLARYRLAECQVGVDDFPRAIETLQSLAAADSLGDYGARAVVKIGDLYYGRELYPSAIAAYRRYLQSPAARDRDKLMFRLGKIYQEKYQRFGAALREFENLLKQYPGSSLATRTFLAIAQCNEAEGDYGAAIRNYEYIGESGGDKALVEEADERARYLRAHRLRDAESAAHLLAELLQVDPARQSPLDRLFGVGEVFEKHLKDYNKALEVYGEILALEPPVTDSVRAEVLLRQAGAFEKLCEKAGFDGDGKMAEFTRAKAVEKYRIVIDSFSTSPCADDAAYNLILLTSPNLAEYEAFIGKYPRSNYLPGALRKIAEYYEDEASGGDTKLYARAADAYRRIVDQFPSSANAPSATLGLARCCFALGLLDSLQSVVNGFHERFAGSAGEPEAYFMGGLLAKRRGDHGVAVDVFKQVLYRYPFSPFAARSRYELAQSELATGKVFDALGNFQVYEQSYPGGEYAVLSRYGVARCLLRLDRRDEAVELLTALLSEALPEAVVADLNYELGCVAESKGDAFGALNRYKRALGFGGFAQRGDVYRRMGRLYFDSRLYGDAARALEKAYAAAPSESDSAAMLAKAAVAMIMNGEGKDADKLIGKLDERFPKYTGHMADIVFHEGLYYFVKKQYDKALKRFEYVETKYEQSDRVDDAAYQVALTYFYSDKTDDALRLFTEFPTKFPQSEFVPSAYFKIGMIYHERDEFARAAETFVRAAEHEKVDGKTRFRAAYNAAVAYQKISSWLDAARLYEVVLGDSSGEARPSSLHLKTGFCLIQASRFEEALDHFQLANGDPAAEEKPEILYWIGTCYSKLGEYQKAISEYLKVPYLYAGIGKWGVTAEFEAGRLYERQGEYSKALSLYRKIVRSDGENGRFGREAARQIQRLNTLTEDSP